MFASLHVRLKSPNCFADMKLSISPSCSVLRLRPSCGIIAERLTTFDVLLEEWNNDDDEEEEKEEAEEEGWGAASTL